MLLHFDYKQQSRVGMDNQRTGHVQALFKCLLLKLKYPIQNGIFNT
ncbi:hypothetical protein pb186bvf_009382 [Paramecium bursaria]